MWLEDLDKYCARHGITRRQFASIFGDTNFEHSWRSLIWSSGEPVEWIQELRK